MRGQTTEKHLFTSEQKLEAWGLGEWVEEADEIEWEYKEIKCEIKRSSYIKDDFICGMGHLNGYIILPRNHPWNTNCEKINANVHGRITYCSMLEDGSMTIGFDCSHYNDETPYTPKKMLFRMMNQVEIGSEQYFNIRTALERMQMLEKYETLASMRTYKNINYVQCECESLVDQMLGAKV